MRNIDLVELSGGVSVTEVARPAAQEAVDIMHDLIDIHQQPAPVRELMDPVAGALHGLTRGPAGQEAEMPRRGRVAAHPAVMEAEKVEPLPAFA
jgi:hypothetical protein